MPAGTRQASAGNIQFNILSDGKGHLTREKGTTMSNYNPKSLKAEEFISDEEIRETLAYAEANKHNEALIDEILEKARRCRAISFFLFVSII